MYQERYGAVYSTATNGGLRSRASAARHSTWDPAFDLREEGRPYFDSTGPDPAPIEDIHGARVLVIVGDCVTTDHISPAGSIAANTPAARYLESHGVARPDFNSYGARRGNHEVMVRGTFANSGSKTCSPRGQKAG